MQATAGLPGEHVANYIAEPRLGFFMLGRLIIPVHWPVIRCQMQAGSGEGRHF